MKKMRKKKKRKKASSFSTKSVKTKIVKKTILERIREKNGRGPLYMPFIDSTIYDMDEIVKISKNIENSMADMIVVGGILNVDTNYFNQVIKKIKEVTNLPIIILPSNTGMISRHDDAIFFTSLLNSRNPYWITGSQALSAPSVYFSGVEVIPTAYLVVEPGGTSSWIGDANPLPKDKLEIVKAYTVYSELSGKEMVCLDTGMVDSKIPDKIIKTVKENTSLPIAFYGGVKTLKDINKLAKAGADIIITSTVIQKHKKGLRLRHLISMRKKKSKKKK
ncbi:MAG: phosphoglycerol geranylgeranyltransferase [Candidatus Aenigmarchaeota archaeon]|nr:phosphoglycerol geranylgeranyltransferase [Candidatus Aenigmarchaeota archaeon]